jgi:hypothetical protein
MQSAGQTDADLASGFTFTTVAHHIAWSGRRNGGRRFAGTAYAHGVAMRRMGSDGIPADRDAVGIAWIAWRYMTYRDFVAGGVENAGSSSECGKD